LLFCRKLQLNAAKMSKELLKDKRKIKAADAVKILGNNGIDISEKDAEKILDFLYFLGKLTVDQYTKEA